MQPYINIYIHISSHTHAPTHLPKVLPTVYYSCDLVLSGSHKPYQKYFDILLKYEKLEINCCKKINEYLNEF